MKALSIAILVSSLLLLPAGESRSEEGIFSFYGLEFGMTPLALKEIYPRIEGTQILAPGHGMSSLEIFFDREELLMEIRATYERPEGKFESIGLMRALREKFLLSVRENHPGVEVSIDEYANRAAVTVIFLSSGIREKNIEHFKREHLKTME